MGAGSTPVTEFAQEDERDIAVAAGLPVAMDEDFLNLVRSARDAQQTLDCAQRRRAVSGGEYPARRDEHAGALRSARAAQADGRGVAGCQLSVLIVIAVGTGEDRAGGKGDHGGRERAAATRRGPDSWCGGSVADVGARGDLTTPVVSP